MYLDELQADMPELQAVADSIACHIQNALDCESRLEFTANLRNAIDETRELLAELKLLLKQGQQAKTFRPPL